jgi:O-antigen/teichoic acid export membrane protein
MRRLARELGERLGQAVWSGVAGVLPRLALLVAGLFVAQRFGADAFARYSLAAVTLALAGSLPGVTLTTVASKYVPEFAAGAAALGAGFRAIAVLSAVLAVAIGCAVFALAHPLAVAFGVEPPIDGLLRITSLAIAASIVSGGLAGLLVGSARFRASALAQLAGFVAFALALAALQTTDGRAGLELVLAALALLYAVAALAAAVQARTGFARDMPPRLRPRVRKLWSFFVPTLLAAGTVVPVVWISNALLSRSADSLADLARFNAAYQWYAVVSFIPAVLAQIEFVRMSHAKARGDVAGLATEMRRFMARNAIVMLPVALAGVIVAPWLAGFYRLEGAAAERTMQLMFCAALVASLGNPAGLFLAVVDRIWLASALNVGWGIITLAAAWLAFDAGSIGVAAAFLGSHVVHALGATAIARRLVAVRPRSL